MKTLTRQIRGLPLFPVIPLVPMALVGASIALSAWCFARVRMLSRMVLSQPMAAEGV